MEPSWRAHKERLPPDVPLSDVGGKIGVQPHIIEAVLNHISGQKAGVPGIYSRAIYASEKRAALQRWADHMRSLADGVETNLLPFSVRSLVRDDLLPVLWMQHALARAAPLDPRGEELKIQGVSVRPTRKPIVKT
jgi:hypothetical protein